MSETKIPEDLRKKYKGRTFPAAFSDLISDLAERIAAAEAREKMLIAENGKTLLLLQKAAFETIPALESREKKLREEIERLREDASWAATHRSELADLRDAFKKSESENTSLLARLAEATKPVTDEERDQLNKSTDYAMGDTLERIIPLIDAIIAARAAKGGG